METRNTPSGKYVHLIKEEIEKYFECNEVGLMVFRCNFLCVFSTSRKSVSTCMFQL